VRRFAALFAAALLAFAPAAAHALATLAAPHTVEFELVQDRQILFPITVNGVETEAWLDSGSSTTVVDAAFARQIGLQLGDEIKAAGVAGPIANVRLSQAELKIGDVAVPARQVAVMDLSPVSSVTPRPIHVILGREVFQLAVLQIDFQRRQIAFLPRSEFTAPDPRPIPLHRSGPLRSFPVAVGGVTTDAILDLGNSGSLLLDRGFAERRGLLKGRRTSTQLSVGADGAREALILSLDNVWVGGTRFQGVPAVATQLTTQAPANVGLEILKRFRVTIDFAGDRLWLEPQEATLTAPFRKNRAGISVLQDKGRVRISHVAPGSPAEAAGWRVGEEFTAVDGQRVDAGYRASPLAQWTHRPAGTMVRLTMADGSERALILADYF